MASTIRSQVSLVMGIVMVSLALVFLARMTIFGRPPATGKFWLDAAFIAFFLLRGWMNFREARRTPVTPAEPDQQF